VTASISMVIAEFAAMTVVGEAQAQFKLYVPVSLIDGFVLIIVLPSSLISIVVLPVDPGVFTLKSAEIFIISHSA